MSEALPVPVVTLDGDVPGSAFIPNQQFPGKMRLQTAVGSTLMFATVSRPEIFESPEAKERYQSHRHSYQDAELVVNGETLPAVEVQDADLGIHVRAADLNGYAVVVSVPLGTDIPGVTVEWPEG